MAVRFAVARTFPTNSGFTGAGPGGYAPPSTRRSHPKMRIVAEGGDAFTVPYAPRETTADGLTPVFTSAERGGAAPLLLRASDGLPQVSFDLVFGHPDPQVSIEPQLAALRALAASGKRMRVSLDPTTSRGLWRLTSFSQQVTSRQHGTNHPTRATCSLTFQRASDAVVAVGPLSGGHKGRGKDKGKGKHHPKSYVVRRGDTLSSIAVKFYGDASKWHKIADANHLRHPRKVKVGRKLILP